MAVYKVPQDVEADDKLIGPFSFRQFVYLIIVAMAIGLAWGLAQLFIPLAIVPLPIILLFGALALPLRKDQPMETYMAAMVSFFLKPHHRLWDPDGIDSLIEVTTPKMVEVQRIKNITQGEAERSFNYLAEIIDTQGWSVRGSGVHAPNSAMISDAYFEAQQTQDIMDSNNAMAQSFSQKLSQSDARRHQDAMNIMLGQTTVTTQTTPTVNYFDGPTVPVSTATVDPNTVQRFDYNPYPDEMQQAIINPVRPAQTRIIGPAKSVAKPATSTSEKPTSAGIIRLANNSDLSIETIAREANRINKEQDFAEEVIISLR